MPASNVIKELIAANSSWSTSGDDLSLSNIDLSVKSLTASGAVIGGGAASAALTTQLTTITITDAAGTPDYALSALTTTTPYGLATLAEMVSLLYVIKNLQTRTAEIEAALEAAGIVTAN